jgi:hypothetical protein
MDVVTLQPGAGGNKPMHLRSDYTPIAQPPDKHGIMAHTPDPTTYHFDSGGRVIVPRATRFGGSRAYNVHSNGATLNIDPSDPVCGTGGVTVQLNQLNKQAMKHAVEEAGEDATLAWAIAAHQSHLVSPAPPPKPREAPNGYGNYVVPAATPSGGQYHPSIQAQVVPSGMNGHNSFHPAVIRPANSPAIQGQAMAAPMPIPQEQAPQPQYQQPVPQQAQPVYQPPQMQQAYQQPPQYTPQPQYGPPPPQYQQAPAGPDPMQMMQAMMAQFTQAIQGLQRPQPAYVPPTPPQPLQVPGVPPYQLPSSQVAYQGPQSVEEDEEDDEGWQPTKPQQQRQAQAQPVYQALPADCKLPFLTAVPARPRLRVLFDLGKGGIHSKNFHEIAKQGVCLSLIYDDRYDGDRFIPMETDPGESIKVKLPKRRDEEGNEVPPEVLHVAVPNFHQTIGCLAILNLIIIPDERIPSPREVLEDQQ